MQQKSLFSFIPFLLLTIPILEIGVFILVGGQIGVINTLLGVLLTAILGTILLRHQGFALVGQAQRQMDQGKIPGKELAHGVMLLAAGIMLLTPGFVTDSIGFLLLVPTFRDVIFNFLKQKMDLTGAGKSASGASFHSFHFASRQNTNNGRNAGDDAYKNRDRSIIDLDEDEFSEVDDHKKLGKGADPKSPWNKNGA